MNGQILEKMEKLSVSMEHLTGQVKLVNYMIEQVTCGNLTDNEENTREHIDMLWSFSSGLVELAHMREKDVDAIYNALQDLQKVGAV
ncbi:MAG: hypothetical protein NC245_00730 [Muribaculum sp.]|nr:hypothetical protein [Muribaculum sp.]